MGVAWLGSFSRSSRVWDCRLFLPFSVREEGGVGRAGTLRFLV